MSNKFEQLLDYLVNEEMDKANELFHEIVVEKSRDIYETIISEEEAEDGQELGQDAVEEGTYEEDEYEDAFGAQDDEDEASTADASDKSLDDIEMDTDSEMDDEMGPDASEDAAMMDIKNAIEELEAAFAELEAAQGGEPEMGMDSDFGDEEDGEDDEFSASDDNDKPEEGMMAQFEGRRITREYVEKVGSDWDKNSQKTQGQSAGADTGDKMGSPSETKSTVNTKAAATAPKTGAHAGNILGDHSTGEGTNVGTKPTGKAGGLVKNAQDMKTGNGNVPGGNMGIKNLSKVAGGHGAEKKGAAAGPVGSGTGDKAGQTTIANIPQFLKKL